MRFNEAVCNSMPPMHIGLQNNNQLQRSSSEIILNDKPSTDNNSSVVGLNNALSGVTGQDPDDFRLGQDTSTYSSLAAVTRNNKLLEHNLNNNLEANIYQSSSTESLADYEGYYEDPEQEVTGSDWSEYSEDANLPAGCRGIVNPNYPGFQHLGPSLLSDTDDTDEDERELDEDDEEEDDEDDDDDDDDSDEDIIHEDEFNNNNNNNNNIVDETVNRLDAHRDEQKQQLYEKPKFNVSSVSSLIECMNYVKSVQQQEQDPTTPTTNVADDDGADGVFEAVEVVQLTTSVKESLQFPEIEDIPDSSKCSEAEEIEETPAEDPIDLIREANALTSLPNTLNNNLNNLAESTNPSSCILTPVNNLNNNEKPSAPPSPTIASSSSSGKLDEIDLLASIKHHHRVPEAECRQHQRQSSVPDVVVMEPHVDRATQQQDTNKMVNADVQVVSQETYNGEAKKKEKMLRNQARRRQQNVTAQTATAGGQRGGRHRAEIEIGGFDVYNIETAMPKIDMDAIEIHLKAAREEERRRRNDREEIRKRLAMGPDADDMRAERGRKPSLQSRLQSGMNLQICFMNETASDTESAGHEGPRSAAVASGHGPTSPLSPDSPTSSSSSSSSSGYSIASSPSKLQLQQLHNLQQNIARPQVLSLPPLRLESTFQDAPIDEADFFARQARLQTEARMALAQAKEMAHMQMEVERQKLKQNPITEMVRESLSKIGVTLGEERRRLTRALLTELNIAQLQVLANDLHARIATLNEALVDGLLRRDDLHMEQDSMLVDVEDLTRYLGAKQESFKKRQQVAAIAKARQQQQQQRHLQQQHPRTRTLALLSRASSTRLAAGRQLVVSLVRK